MPIYEIQHPRTGKTYQIDAPSRPSEEQLRSILAQFDAPSVPETPSQFLMSEPDRSPAAPQPDRGVLGMATDVAQGFGAGAAKTVFHGGDLIRRGLGMDRIIDQPDVQAAMTPPDTTSGRVGFGAEQLGEFLIPLGVGPNLVKRFAEGSRLAGFGLKSVGEAAEFGAKTAVQTGGDWEQVITAALLGSTTPVLSEAFRAAGGALFKSLPSKLYNQVFKLAEKEIAASWKGASRGQTIKPTLAEEVIERGLRGSPRNMGIYVNRKIDSYEAELQSHLKGKLIRLPGKDFFVGLLDDVATTFGGRFARKGREAARLAHRLKATPARDVKATDALRLKRLLDDVRTMSSFRADARLGPRQDEFKGAADFVRKVLKRRDTSVTNLLNEERVFINARSDLVSDYARRRNAKLLTWSDILIGGGSTMTGVPGIGIGVMGLVRGMQQPFFLTGIGQSLFRLGRAVPAGTAETSARAIAATGPLVSR